MAESDESFGAGPAAPSVSHAVTGIPRIAGGAGGHIPVPLRQVVDVVGHLSDGPVEVKLRPEELGAVRLRIAHTESGLSLVVMADRPDTLDLMRRHAEMLQRELSAAGFGALDISFGESSRDGGERTSTAKDDRDRIAAPRSDARAEGAGGARAPAGPRQASPALDIRI